MAWRVTDNLIEGTLDNTVPGKVTGTLRFIGRKRPVRLDLAGNIDGAAAGKRIILRNNAPTERNCILKNVDGGPRQGSYMVGFAQVQRGETGTMKVDEHGAYLEWYGDTNGRVVIELPLGAVQVVNE